MDLRRDGDTRGVMRYTSTMRENACRSDLLNLLFGIALATPLVDDEITVNNGSSGNCILKDNPFMTIDTDGVGVCGEHGGDRATSIWCHHVGLDYVSCSRFRVPVARLAAAQAALDGETT